MLNIRPFSENTFFTHVINIRRIVTLSNQKFEKRYYSTMSILQSQKIAKSNKLKKYLGAIDAKGLTVKQLLKNSSPTYSLPPICAHEYDTVYKFKDQEKAQLLNDYFCSIASLDNDNKDIPYMTDRGSGILTENNDIISCLNPQKASGPDDISHRMLINCH